MAGLLSFLAGASRAGLAADTGRMQGEREGLLAKMQRDEMAAERQRRTLLDQLNARNIESQIADREADNARLAMPAPVTPRNIDPLSPEGISARLEYERQLRQLPQNPSSGPQGTFSQFTDANGQPVFFNPTTRQSVQAPEGFKPPSTRAGLPTEAERKAAAFYASGSKGYETLERLLGGDDPATPQVETGKGKEVPGWFAQQAAKIGLGAGNVMTNEQVRQMRQAALMLSDAWLRYTSGAAVPEQEVERFAESFIPRAGDDPGTLAQKAEARKTIIEALKRGAGRALDPSLVGTAPGMNDLDGQIDAVLRGTP